MMKHKETHKKTIYRAFVGFLCAFILLSGIGFGISRANASNVYTSDISFFQSGGDLFFKFFVNTSFTMGSVCGSTGKFNDNAQQAFVLAGSPQNYISPVATCYDAGCGGAWRNCDFVAGNIYTINTKAFFRSGTSNYYSLAYYISQMGSPTTSHFAKFIYVPISDTEAYYFTETPTLSISYPFENAEISQAFNVQGSYTIPTGYDRITAYVGQGIPYAQYSFTQNLTDPGGNIDIRISGIPSGNYQMFFYFSGDSVESYYAESATINFSVLTAIAPELPGTGETPPEFFDPIDADQYYIDFSNYETPTALYNNLKNAIQPIFTAIGSNLTFFTSRFDSGTAKETGEKTGQAILIIRSYSSNLNTFFNDLPVSEFLLFYLSLLIMVIVFRIIKNLINLIKP